MTRERALAILRELQPALEARGVAHVGLFGSVARDAVRTGSDIDLLVTPAVGRRLDLIDLGSLQTLFEYAFDGSEIDIVLAPVHEPTLQASISRDGVLAF
jgi:predicted nucleotidyltransferase